MGGVYSSKALNGVHANAGSATFLGLMGDEGISFLIVILTGLEFKKKSIGS